MKGVKDERRRNRKTAVEDLRRNRKYKEELEITRDYIHEKGLEWELLSKCIRRK